MKAMSANTCLTKLLLSSNQITEKSAQCISKALQINKQLKHLDLGNNNNF